MADSPQYTCPCCGFITLAGPRPGSYDICEICFWEDDPIQFDHPDSGGGANTESLKEAQQNYIQFGACGENMIVHVRKPNENDVKDPNWSPY